MLIEGFRPGVAERLGLGPEVCQARNPSLVYGRMTGFGQTGPLAPAAGHDLNYIALTGVLDAIGPAGARPVPPLNLVGDYGGGALYLAFGLMAALFERQRSGRGQVVDAAMVDGAASLMSIFYGLRAGGSWDGGRGENLLDGGAPFYDTYATADGRHLSVAALEPKFFAELAKRIGLDERFVARQYDRRLWPELREALSAVFQRKSRDEWCALLEGSDACVAPVLSLDEAAQHAHARGARGLRRGRRRDAAGPAPRFDRTPAGRPRPAPELGAQGDELLREAGLGATSRSRRCGPAGPCGDRLPSATSNAARRAPRGLADAAARRRCRPRGADAAPRRARRRPAQRRLRLPRWCARPGRPAGACASASARTTPSASARLGLPEGGLDYLVAAVRESFEEVGLLLACDAAGEPGRHGAPMRRPCIPGATGCRTDRRRWPTCARTSSCGCLGEGKTSEALLQVECCCFWWQP